MIEKNQFFTITKIHKILLDQLWYFRIDRNNNHPRNKIIKYNILGTQIEI